MTKPNFAVTRCSNNPHRWNVHFNNSTSFNMHSIRQQLEKHQFQVLATSPSVLVVRSKEARLTWHNEGLIQVDMYNHSSCDVNDIEHLIKDILDVDTVSFSGESLG